MRKIIILTTLLALFSFISSCKKQTPETKMVVTSVYGDVYINETKDNVKAGSLVRQSDVVRTENGRVALQNRNGTTILIKEFSKIRVAKLTNEATNVETINSSMLLRVNKTSKTEEFNVNTPTAVAGVRGTTFFVYSTKEGTIINSVEGQVAVRNVATNNENVLEKKSIEITQGGENVKNYMPSATEITDIVTLINVSPENIDRASSGDLNNFNDEVQEKTKKAEKDAIDIIKNSSFSAEVIKSTLVLKNGSRVRGNVVYQTSDKLFIIDETKTAREIEKSTVSSIEFF